MSSVECIPQEPARLRWLTLFRGLLALALVGVLLLWNEPSQSVLMRCVGALALGGGALNIALALSLCRFGRWRPLVALGTVEVAVGLWLLAAPPITFALFMTIAGLWMALGGFVALWYALLVGYAERDRTYVFSTGLAGFLFGSAALWADVTPGMLRLVLIGYALLAGLLLLAAAWRLWGTLSAMPEVG